MQSGKSHIIPFILASCLFFFAGCEIDQKEILPEDGFLKIFNHPEEELAFYPESLIELPGGGYLLLSGVKDEHSENEYPYASLVRTSGAGEVTWSMDYEWLAPSSGLFLHDGAVGFVAMTPQFEAHVVLIDPASGNVSASYPLEVTMPLFAHKDASGNLLVLGYDFVTRSSWISKFNSSFTLQRSNKLPVNTDLEYLVQRHLNKTGQSYPYFIGEYSNESGTGYYVNCFYNYTLRTVFLDVSSLSESGDIYSFQIEEGISSLVQKSGNLFGLTSYYEGNNYMMPEVVLDVSSSANIKDLPADPLYELTYKAEVVAGNLVTDTEAYALFVSQTNDDALVIFQYAMESDSLIRTHTRNFDQRVEVCDFIQTADKGLAILARIYILGKYQRPVLIKIPEASFLPEEE